MLLRSCWEILKFPSKLSITFFILELCYVWVADGRNQTEIAHTHRESKHKNQMFW